MFTDGQAHKEIVDIITELVLSSYKERYILGKTLEQLNDDERQFFKEKLQEMTILTENGCKILIPTTETKWTKDGFIEQDCLGKKAPIIYDDSEDISLSKRFMENKSFREVTPGMVSTNFRTMQEDETLGQYLDRMKESISLLARFVNGENIDFNKYRDGVQQEQNKLLESAIQATTNVTRTSQINEQVLQIKEKQKDKNEKDIEK